MKWLNFEVSILYLTNQNFLYFRTKFHSHLKNIFDTLSEFTDPICEKINAKASKILIADTTGYEANVVESNHNKHLGAIVKRLIN